MKYIYVLLIVSISHVLFSQPYTVSSYQSEYQPLTEYTSICDENLDARDFDLELNFDFPYQDTFFRTINANNRGIYSFYDVEGSFPIALLNFIYDDTSCNQEGEDARYIVTEHEGKKVAIVENNKLRLANDQSVDEYDSSFTFQNWFFEDGSMEIHFGKSNLDNSIAYVEGEGFYLDGGPSSPLGPYIYMDDYNTDDRLFSVNGPYDDLTGVEIGPSVLTVIPPEGWVIRLEYVTLNIEDKYNETSIACFPNPTAGLLKIELSDMISGSLSVKTVTGQAVYMDKFDFTKEVSLDLYGHAPGMYLIEVVSGNGGRFLERVVLY